MVPARFGVQTLQINVAFARGHVYGSLQRVLGSCWIIPDARGHVLIPTRVTAIEAGAVENCRNLKSVDFPSTVTSIGNDAFLDTRLTSSIVVPHGVTSIGTWAFYNKPTLLHNDHHADSLLMEIAMMAAWAVTSQCACLALTARIAGIACP